LKSIVISRMIITAILLSLCACFIPSNVESWETYPPATATWVYPESVLSYDSEYFGDYPQPSLADTLTPHFGYEYNTRASTDIGYIYDGLPQTEWPEGLELITAINSNPELVNTEIYGSDSIFFGNMSSTAPSSSYGTFDIIFTLDIPDDLEVGYYQLGYFGQVNFCEYVSDANPFSALYATTLSDSLSVQVGIGHRTGIYTFSYNWSYSMQLNEVFTSDGAMEDWICQEAIGGVNQGMIMNNGTLRNVWNISYAEPFYSDSLDDLRIDFRVNIASDVWTKINMASYENGLLRVFLASFGVLLRPITFEGTQEPSTTVDATESIQGIYYLIVFMGMIAMCFASSYSIKNDSFSFETFMASLSIGITILIWLGVMPSYLLLIPSMIIAGTLFLKVRSE